MATGNPPRQRHDRHWGFGDGRHYGTLTFAQWEFLVNGVTELGTHFYHPRCRNVNDRLPSQGEGTG